MKEKNSLQDTFLGEVRSQQTPVAVYLVSGVRLTGVIEDFDRFVIFLKNGSRQMIQKSAVSTVLPLSGH